MVTSIQDAFKLSLQGRISPLLVQNFLVCFKSSSWSQHWDRLLEHCLYQHPLPLDLSVAGYCSASTSVQVLRTSGEHICCRRHIQLGASSISRQGSPQKSQIYVENQKRKANTHESPYASAMRDKIRWFSRSSGVSQSFSLSLRLFKPQILSGWQGAHSCLLSWDLVDCRQIIFISSLFSSSSSSSDDPFLQVLVGKGIPKTGTVRIV